jgi:hypothetical protein
MKIRSYNRSMVLSLVTAVVLVVALWPATGRSQGTSQRDRSRRDMSSRSRSSSSEQARRQISAQKSQVTKPVEPNTAGAKPDAGIARQSDTEPPMESPKVEGSDAWAPYNIILQRNIFSRNRTPFRPRDRSSEAPVVVPNPETHFLLNGVVQENNEFIAFIEDTQSGGVLRLRQGDRVARGAIKTLSLDALEYQLEDKTISIRLGCDLEGTRGFVAVSTASAPSASPATTTAPAGQPVQTQQPAPAPSGDEAEIIKRLMEQRRQQLGQ